MLIRELEAHIGRRNDPTDVLGKWLYPLELETSRDWGFWNLGTTAGEKQREIVTDVVKPSSHVTSYRKSNSRSSRHCGNRIYYIVAYLFFKTILIGSMLDYY